MIIMPADGLREYVSSVLLRLEAAPAVAARVAEALVESNLVGHDSHGVMRIAAYAEAIRAGTLKPAGTVATVRETAATIFLDCGWNFGHYACVQGLQAAMVKARSAGIGLAVLRHCDHTGRIGEYVTMAAEQGFVGQVVCNGSSPGGLVAPFGGMTRALGANPIAWGVPGGPGEPPVYLDFATAAAAHGKLEVAADKGDLVPEGWILDKHGQPTRKPQDALDGGAILPFGGHKGYALGVMIELIGGGLSGVGFPLLPAYRWDQGTVISVINIETFQPLRDFRARVGEFTERLKALPRAPGQTDILLPGQLEWRTRAARASEGIPLPEVTVERLREVARSVGLTL
jgi:LDH2 family malate/lactate/ureidoglycolate dehydrogenase